MNIVLTIGFVDRENRTVQPKEVEVIAANTVLVANNQMMVIGRVDAALRHPQLGKLPVVLVVDTFFEKYRNKRLLFVSAIDYKDNSKYYMIATLADFICYQLNVTCYEWKAIFDITEDINPLK